jgi:hypothetical protein
VGENGLLEVDNSVKQRLGFLPEACEFILAPLATLHLEQFAEGELIEVDDLFVSCGKWLVDLMSAGGAAPHEAAPTAA